MKLTTNSSRRLSVPQSRNTSIIGLPFVEHLTPMVDKISSTTPRIRKVKRIGEAR